MSGNSGGGSGGSNNNGTGGSNGSGSNSDPGNTIHNEQQLLDFLITQGAVGGSGLSNSTTLQKSAGTTGGSLSGSTGGSGKGTLSVGAAGGGSGGGSGGGNFSVTVVGSKIRAALSNKYKLQDLLQGWRDSKKGAMSTRDYGLVAASTALRDSSVQSVSFTASTFEIVYRSEGYLFGLFPISFPVRISIIPQAISGRVSVKLPWYRFFVREFFTTDSLAAEIDATIQTEIAANTDASADLNTKLFDAVATYLRKKIGTISDSIYLGTSVK